MGLLSFFGASPETESRFQKGLLDFQMAFPELRRQKMEEEQFASEAEWKKRQRQMQEAQYKQTQDDRARGMNDDALIQRLYGMPTEGAMPQGQAGPGMPMPNAGIDPQTFLRQGGSVDRLPGIIGLNSAVTPKRVAPVISKPGDIARGEDGGILWKNPEAAPKPDLNSLIVMGPDGNPMVNTALMDAKKAIAAAGASRSQVNVGGGQFENAFSKASGAKFADVYDNINTGGMTAQQQLANVSRMEQLLQGVEGGKLAPLGKEIASTAKTFGVTLDPNLGNKEAAESLAREMALSMRQPGTGPMTDKDFENFMLIVPSLSKTANGRAEIMQTMRSKLQRDTQLAQLAQKYVAEKGVLDTGFYSVAQQFIAKNPVVKAGSAQPVPMPSMADIEAELRKRNK